MKSRASQSRNSASRGHTPVVSLRKSSINSLTDRHSSCHSDYSDLSPRSPHELPIKKPISLAILEKYFSDICQSITQKQLIEPSLLKKAEAMKEVLKDCLSAIHDLSLEIYVLMSSSLKDIDLLQEDSDGRVLEMLLNKLLKIDAMIEDNKYRSTEEPAFQGFDKSEEVENKDLAYEFTLRANRVTARILNIWKKIVSPQKESGIICCCFLLLFCEVDKSIKISQFLKIKYDRAVNTMRDYLANPGYVVTVIRKTREYIEKEMISKEIIRRIHENLAKISYERARNIDQTLTALALYDFLLYAVKYYQFIYQHRHNFNVLDKRSSELKPTTANLSDKKSGISQSENFGIVLSIDRPKHRELKPFLNTKPIKKIPIKSISIPLARSSVKSMTARSPFKPSKIFSSLKNNTRSVVHSPSQSLSPQKAIKTPTKSPQSRSKTQDHSDILEEMQYQQFIEEKFRTFLVGKINGNRDDSLETKIRNEETVIRNRENWMKEFECKVGVIRFNAIKKLGDERRFTAELIRAQKQLEIMKKK